MEASQDVTKLSKAMLQVQQALQPAAKDANNPFTKSRYATLTSVMAACRDALLSNGVLLTQFPSPAEAGQFSLVTRLTHAESGQWMACTATCPLPKQDPQGFGIAMTYLRRYSLSAMLGIVTEEDTDGELHSEQATAKQQYSRSRLPQIPGIRFQETKDLNGKPFIVAEGDTLHRQEELKQQGFHWDPKQRVWWRHAA